MSSKKPLNINDVSFDTTPIGAGSSLTRDTQIDNYSFDQDKNPNINPTVYGGNTNFNDLSESYQTGWDKFANGLLQGTETFGSAIINGVASVASLGYATGTQLKDLFTGEDKNDFMDNWLRNDLMKGLNELDETFKTEVAPIRLTEEQQKDPFAAASLWGGFANGVGFLASAIIPTSIISKLTTKPLQMAYLANLAELANAEDKAFKLLSKAEKLKWLTNVKTGDKLDDIVSKIQKLESTGELEAGASQAYLKYQKTLSFKGDLAGSIYSRIGESQMEAYDTYKQIMEKNQYKVDNGEITEEQLHEIASSNSNKVFGTNMLLSLMEFKQYRSILKGGATLPEIFLEKGLAKGINMTKMARIGKGLTKIGVQSVSEGTEELLQFGMQEAAKKLADNQVIGKDDSYLVNMFKETIEGLSKPEGQVSALLGAVLGGGMTGYQQATSKENDRHVANSKQAADLYNKYTNNGEKLTDDAFVEKDGKIRLSKEILSKVNNYQVLDALKNKAKEDGDKVGEEQYGKLLDSFIVTNKIIEGNYDEHINMLKTLQKKSKDAVKQELGLTELKTVIDPITGENKEIDHVAYLEDKIQEAKEYKQIYDNFHLSDSLANLSFDTKQKMVYNAYTSHINNKILKGLNKQINDIENLSSNYALNVTMDSNNPLTGIDLVDPAFRATYTDLMNEKNALLNENKNVLDNYKKFEENPEAFDFNNIKKNKEEIKEPSIKEKEILEVKDFVNKNANKVFQTDTDEETPEYNILKDTKTGELFKLNPDGIYYKLDAENKQTTDGISAEEAKKKYEEGALTHIGTKRKTTSNFYKILPDGTAIDRDGNVTPLTKELVAKMTETTITDDDLLFNEEELNEFQSLETRELNEQILNNEIETLYRDLNNNNGRLDKVNRDIKTISDTINTVKNKVKRLQGIVSRLKVNSKAKSINNLVVALQEAKQLENELVSLKEKQKQLEEIGNKLFDKINIFENILKDEKFTLLSENEVSKAIAKYSLIRNRLLENKDSLTNLIVKLDDIIKSLLDLIDNLIANVSTFKSVFTVWDKASNQVNIDNKIEQLLKLDDQTNKAITDLETTNEQIEVYNNKIEALERLLELGVKDYNLNTYLETNSRKALEQMLINFRDSGGFFSVKDAEQIKKHLLSLGIPANRTTVSRDFTKYDDFNNLPVDNIDNQESNNFYGARKDITQLSSSTTSRQYEDKEATIKTKGKWNHILNKFLEQLDLVADKARGITYQLRVVTFEKNPEFFTKEEVAAIKAKYPNVPNPPIFKGVVVSTLKIKDKKTYRNIRFNKTVIGENEDKTEAVSVYFHSSDFTSLTNKGNLTEKQIKELREQHKKALAIIYNVANSGQQVFINIDGMSNGIINVVNQDAELNIQDQLYPNEKTSQDAINKVDLFVNTLVDKTKKTFNTVFANFNGKRIPLKTKTVSREAATTVYNALVKFLENGNKNVILDEKSGVNVFDIIKQHVYWAKKNNVYFEKGILHIKDKEFAFNEANDLVVNKEEIITAFQNLFSQIDANGLRNNDKEFILYHLDNEGKVIKTNYSNYKSYVLDKANPRVSTNIVMNNPTSIDDNMFKSLYLNIQSLVEVAENKKPKTPPNNNNNNSNNSKQASKPSGGNAANNNKQNPQDDAISKMPIPSQMFSKLVNRHGALAVIKKIVDANKGLTIEEIAKKILHGLDASTIKNSVILDSLFKELNSFVGEDEYTVADIIPYIDYLVNVYKEPVVEMGDYTIDEDEDTNDIEAKKADIERRRQEELDNSVGKAITKNALEKANKPSKTKEQANAEIEKVKKENKELIDKLEDPNTTEEEWDKLADELGEKFRGTSNTFSFDKKEGKIKFSYFSVGKNGAINAQYSNAEPSSVGEYEVGDLLQVSNGSTNLPAKVTKVSNTGRVLEAKTDDGTVVIRNGYVLDANQVQENRVINAKYDAELAALEQQFTTPNQSVIDAKKADIEKEIYDALNTDENYNNWSNIRDNLDRKQFEDAIDFLLSQFKNSKKELTEKLINAAWDSHKVGRNKKTKAIVIPLLLKLQSLKKEEPTEKTDTFSIDKRKEEAESKITPIEIEVVDKAGNKTGETRIKEYATVYGEDRLSAKTEEELKNKINAKYDAELAALEEDTTKTPVIKSNIIEGEEPNYADNSDNNSGFGNNPDGVKSETTNNEEKPEINIPVLSTVKVDLSTLSLSELENVAKQLRQKAVDAREAEKEGKVILGGSAFIENDYQAVKQYITELKTLNKATTNTTNKPKIQAPEDKNKLYDPSKGNVPIENIDTFKEWFYARFPKSINVEVVYNLIRNRAMGNFRDLTITLWESASEGTGFHEAFHAAFDIFYTEKQKQQIYKEFNAKEGYGKTFRGIEKKYSEFTYLEIEESLADEFQELILNDTNGEVTAPKGFISNMLWKMFQDIKNFFQHLFFNKTYKDILFEKIQSGYFNESKPLSFINNEKDKLYDFGSNKFVTKQFTNSVLNSMSVVFFRELVSNYGVAGLSKINDDKDGLTDIYNIIKESHSHVKFFNNAENGSKNFEYAIQEHKKFLKNFGVDITADDDLEVGRGSGDFEKSAIAINPKQTMSNKIKMLMTFTPKFVFDEEDNTIIYDLDNNGFYKKIDSDILYKKLLNSLVGLDSYVEMAEKIKELSQDSETNEDVYRFARLLGILTTRQGEIKQAETLEEANFQQSFRAAFSKSKQKGTATISYNDGKTYILDLTFQKFRKNEVNNSIRRFNYFRKDNLVRSFIKKLGNKSGRSINLINIPAIMARYKNTNGKIAPKDYFNFLGEFGFELVGTYKQGKNLKNDMILPESIKSDIEFIYNTILNHHNDGKYKFKISDFYSGFQSDIYGSKYTQDFATRIKNLIEFNYDNNLEKSLSYESVDGKRIYAIALKNYYTLITDKLKAGKIPEHFNYLTNKFIRHSILAAKFFKDGKLDINPDINNGYFNTLGEGITNSKLGKASRFKQELDYILNGKFLNFKEADKSNNYIFDFGEFAAKHQVNDIDILWDKFLKGYLIDELESGIPVMFGTMSKTVRENSKEVLLVNDENENINKAETIKSEIDATINETIENQITYLLNNRILFKNGEKYTLLLDDNGIKKLGYNYKNLTRAEVKMILRYTFVNNLISKQEILKLFIGNPNQYDNFVDLIKRNSLSAANKLFPDVSSEWLESLNKVAKKSNGESFTDRMNVYVKTENSSPTFSLNTDTELNDYLKNTLGLSDDAIDSYQKGTKHTDGSGFIMPDLYRQFMLSIGAKWTEKEEKLWNDLLDNKKPLSEIESDAIFNVLKLQYSYINENGETITMKFAVLPYFPKYFPKSTLNGAELKSDLVIYPSATKVAKWSGNKEVNIEGLGLQVDNPQKEKKEVNIITQMEKHVNSNMFDNGEISEENQHYVDTINATKQAIINLQDKENLEKLGITQDGEITNSEKLIEHLENAANSSQLPENDKLAIKTLRAKDGSIRPISLLLIKDRIYPMLQAAFGGIIKYKKRGEQLAQIPSASVDNDLSFYLKKMEDGSRKFTMQVKIPYHLKGNEKAIRELTDKVLNLIGARIPVEGLTSIELVEVIGFLPKSMGNTIMLPNGITVKSGTDYDFDKLTLYYPYTDKEGNYLEYLENPNEEELEILFNSYFNKFVKHDDKFKELSEDKKLKQKLVKLLELETPEKQEALKESTIGLEESLDENGEKKEGVPTDILLYYINSKDDLEKEIDNDKKVYYQLKKEIRDTFKGLESKYRQQFDNLSIEEKNGEDRLQNRLLETYTTMLKNESTMGKMLATNSVKELKTISEKFKSMSITAWNGLFDLLENAYQAVANNIGKNQVGIAALHATNNVLCQMAGVKMNITLHFKPEDVTKSLVNKVAIGNREDFHGISMAKRIADYIGGFVDVAKDAWVFDLNLTEYITDVALLLTRSGLSRETVATFTNQPIIKLLNKYNTLAEDGLLRTMEVNEKTGEIELKGQTLYNYINAIKESLKNKTDEKQINEYRNTFYNDLNSENWTNSSEYKTAVKNKDIEEIEDMFEGLTDKEKSTLAAKQLVVLERFLQYKGYARELSDMMQNTNYDTSGVSSNINDTKRRIEATKKVLTNPIFENVDKLFSKTFLGSMFDYIQTVPNKQKRLNITLHPKLSPIIDKVLDRYSKYGEAKFSSIAKTIENELMYFITVTTPLSKFTSNKDGLMGDDALINRLFDATDNQNAIAALSFLKNLRDEHIILKKLISIEGEGEVDNIVSINEFLDKEDNDVLVDDIESILSHPNPKVVEAMELIILNGYMQVGYNNSPTSFTKLIPSILFNNGIANPTYDAFIEKLNNMSDKEVESLMYDNFLPQMYQNNLTNKLLVPVVFDNQAKDDTTLSGKSSDIVIGRTFRQTVKVKQQQLSDNKMIEAESAVNVTKYFYNTGIQVSDGINIFRELQPKGYKETSKDILLYFKEYYAKNKDSKFHSDSVGQPVFSLAPAFNEPIEQPKLVPSNTIIETTTPITTKEQLIEKYADKYKFNASDDTVSSKDILESIDYNGLEKTIEMLEECTSLK